MLLASAAQSTAERSFREKTLDLYHRLGRFADLIFCPLDLPTPPEVPRQALVEWVGAARAQRMTEEERKFTEGASGRYPWSSAYAALRGKWCCGFDAAFPELIGYLSSFPTESWSCVAVLVQEPREAVWLHTDPDPVLGWRVYLGHGGAKVFFCPTFERHAERLTSWTPQGMRDWSKYVRTDLRLYPKLPASSCAWTLNAYRAAHGVDAHEGEAGERVTLLLIPDLDQLNLDAYLALLERSAAKYASYAIWYPGTSA